ncbi:MAG: hypothetical protein OER21_16410, partial [Gemmatimonadota bacterium]|nr:hypothetical protein [Gemmatimonadota bacterium]
ALGEAEIFGWIFGMDRGWAEITRGADMRVPGVFRHVIRYVTPLFITVVFLGALIKPVGRWSVAVGSLFTGDGWPWAPDSVIGRVLHVADSRYAWVDPEGHLTRAFVQDATRMILLLVFIGFAVLVWAAWRRKARGTV